MSAIAVSIAIALPAAQAEESGAAGGVTPSATSRAQDGWVRVSAPVNYLAVQRLRAGVADRRSATWRHQDALGQPRYPTEYRERRTRSEPFLKWIRSLWGERAYRKWKLVVSGLWLRDVAYAPGANAWLRAVEEAQRPFPGTKGWLLSCSASEGGHGRWVPNSQGAPPGGWLQFYESTFWRMFAAARADVEARGFHVPSSAASWYSPLGQALAGAWGVTHGRRHEWAGAGCR